MSATWQLPRRTFLRGLGTAISLPLLDAMLPSAALAAQSDAAPRRLAFFYVPNGIHMPDWTPATAGADFELPAILKPLEPHRQQILVLSGLAHDKAKSNGDGPGDHARSSATFLTGCQAKKTHGKDIRIGVSVDQVAAAQIGTSTKFASLELGCERGQMAGNCDSGYSCAYSSNISWRSESSPMPKEVNPRAIFDRLFSSGNADEAAAAVSRRERYRKSVLDFAREDARRLQQKLGRTDRRKLDEYLASVRSVEQRLTGAAQSDEPLDPDQPLSRPKGVPADFGEHIRLMGDILALAFQMDLTRVATFMIANAGSNRSYPQIDVRGAHHGLSHHGNNKDKQAQISKINHYHMQQFAYLVGKLKSMPEGDATVLDNSMIVYGSGIGDGNRHNHNDLPVLLAGNGGGTIRSGRHVQFPQDTPLTNLYLSMLERVGVHAESLGDSTGRLEGLKV